MLELDLSVWARGARTPFGPAPAAPFASLKGPPRANGPRPHGCELTRQVPLPLTLRLGRGHNHEDSRVLIAARSAVALRAPSPGLNWRRDPIPISTHYQNQVVRTMRERARISTPASEN